MNIYDLDLYFRKLIPISDFDNYDASQNGLQVACSKKPIKKVAFAVDACLDNFQKAAQLNADVLFVHHGLFWGKSLTITGQHYVRIKELIQNDIALYAVHLPLDADVNYGNNAGLARNLELKNIQAFRNYAGIQIGVKGEIPEDYKDGITIEELISKLFPGGEKAQTILPFGKELIKTVGIVSGEGSRSLSDAIAENLDCFITGEIKHKNYHEALEHKINLIAGGHYQTETVGVKLISEKLYEDTKIETVFIHTPTNL